MSAEYPDEHPDTPAYPRLPAYAGQDDRPPPRPKRRRWILLAALVLLAGAQVICWPWIKDNETVRMIGQFVFVGSLLAVLVWIRWALRADHGEG